MGQKRLEFSLDLWLSLRRIYPPTYRSQNQLVINKDEDLKTTKFGHDEKAIALAKINRHSGSKFKYPKTRQTIPQAH